MSSAHDYLRSRGVPDDEIAKADEEGWLDLLALEHLIVPHERKYTPVEVADLAGVPVDRLRRFWRGLGFPDVADDEVAFTDYDLEAITTLNGLLTLRMVDDAVAVQLTRVIGSSMARIAEAEITSSPVFSALDDKQRAELLTLTADMTIPSVVRLLEYAWRHHMRSVARRATLWRATADVSGATELAVGFADLVGFTALSQQLSEAALADVVGRFEEVAFDTVVRAGGRVVKMIGDEAMFVTDTPAGAVAIGLDLAEAYAGEESLSDVRVGVTTGPVLLREGDYYGPVVNLASRIVKVARPGSVVASQPVHDALAGDGRFAWKSLRPRYLKEIGRVPLWVALRPTGERGGRQPAGVLALLTEPQRTRLERVMGPPPSARG